MNFILLFFLTINTAFSTETEKGSKKFKPLTRKDRAIYPAHYIYKSTKRLDSGIKVKIRSYNSKSDKIVPKRYFVLPSDEFERELDLSRSVLKIKMENDHGQSSGTVFKVGEQLYLTAAHVLATDPQSSHARTCKRSSIRSPYYNVSLRCEKIIHCNSDKKSDYCLFQVKKSAEEKLIPSIPMLGSLEKDHAYSLGVKLYSIGNIGGYGLQAAQAMGFRYYSASQVYLFFNDIDKGASGGPLLNSNGTLIGLMISKDSSKKNQYATAAPSHKILNDLYSQSHIKKITLDKLNILY